MNGIQFIPEFLNAPDGLFETLKNTVNWDERMQARKTASYGVAYNYSQIAYPFQEVPKTIDSIMNLIEEVLGFKPNNCLINYYLDGKSKMGFHSDQTAILEEGTGVVVVSLGETRTLRFRNIANKELKKDFPLPSGSLIYMENAVQDEWQHAVPKADTNNGRMSLTFRRIKQ